VLDEVLVPPPEAGRVFRAGRRVRLADADPTGRLRLDACARYLQDIGNDDTAESGIDDPATTWVARRAVIDVHRPPVWQEWLGLATWCGGTGGRWAERRLALAGERGGRVEIATLWVHVDVTTMAPARLPEAFVAAYASAAGGRRVSSRRWLDGPPPPGPAVATRAWPLRAVDVDLLGHVNNAAYWAAVEELLLGGPAGSASEEPAPDGPAPGAARHPLLAAPHRAVIEYGAGIAPGAPVELVTMSSPGRVSVWFTVAGTAHATATVGPLPDGGSVPHGRLRARGGRSGLD